MSNGSSSCMKGMAHNDKHIDLLTETDTSLGFMELLWSFSPLLGVFYKLILFLLSLANLIALFLAAADNSFQQQNHWLWSICSLQGLVFPSGVGD